MLQDSLEAWWIVKYEFQILPLISAGKLLVFPLEMIMSTDYISVLNRNFNFNSLPCLTPLVLGEVQLVLSTAWLFRHC